MTRKYTDTEEALDEINTALEDSRGLGIHQKRLAFVLSAGAVSLIEAYLGNLSVLKPGRKINHRWLKKKKENAKKLIANQIICPIDNLNKLDEFLDIAYKIENKRNDVVYGPPVSEDILREQINLFLELRKKIEDFKEEIKND